MVYYTIQKCKNCGEKIEIEALNFLLNLDKKVICQKCRKADNKTKNKK